MQLDPKAAIYLTLRTAIIWLVTSVWLTVMFGRVGLLTVAIACCFGGIAWFGSWLKIRSYRIELKDAGVTLESGIFAKTHEFVLYNKIQDIQVTQSLLERLLGLSTVIVQTASGSPERVLGLAEADAHTLRDDLVKRATPAA